MQKMNLSEHFTLDEFVKSSTAQLLRLKNEPSPRSIENLQILCQRTLEPIRHLLQRPIYINSGFRCEALNRAVGGTEKSQHLSGEAADIKMKDKEEALDVFKRIRHEIDYDQLLLEQKSGRFWIHVSCKRDWTKNRHQAIIV